MFKYTTAIDKLRKMTARKKVVQGGTSAGKTYGIIPVLIDKAAKNPRLKITVVNESIPAAKDGPVKIFKDIMIETGRWVESRWISNPMEYTFANGSIIQFKSFDSLGKAKASGKRDVLFLNEANHIEYEIADALMIRSKETWIDYNPDNEFWVHTELLQEPNSEFLLLTYHDNEALPPETLEDLQIKLSKAFYEPLASWDNLDNVKSAYWANWCRVYIAGEIGSLQGTIFNFKICEAIPGEAQLIGYGLDWGFTNDPTSLVAAYRFNGELFIKELIYGYGLTNSMIAEKIKSIGVSPYYSIIADSAEPKSITDLWNLGIENVIAAQKGPDSIRHSIDVLQRYELNVTSDSLNLIKELRNYRWDTDPSGQQTNKPIDRYNHAIDAIRYIGLNLLNEAIGHYSFSS